MKKYHITFTFLSLFSFSILFTSEFINTLENGTIEEKIEAMNHLGYSKNKKSFWYLVKYLDFSPGENDTQRSIECRKAAAEALGRIQDDRAVSYLVERWEKEESPLVKEKIIFALKYYKDEKIAQILTEGLADENPGILFQSCITAAHYRDDSLTANVRNVFTSTEDETIKTAAAFALIMLNDEGNEPKKYLADALSSESPWQRYWAAHFIADARLTDLIPELEKCLEIENKHWVQLECERSIVILRTELSRQRRISETRAYQQIIN